MSVDSYSRATERNSCFLIAQSVDGSIVAHGYLPEAAGKLEDHDFLTWIHKSFSSLCLTSIRFN